MSLIILLTRISTSLSCNSGRTPPALEDGLVELEHLSAGKSYMYLEVSQSNPFETIYNATCNLIR